MRTLLRVILCGLLLVSSRARADDRRASPNGSGPKTPSDDVFEMSLPPDPVQPQPAPSVTVRVAPPSATYTAPTPLLVRPAPVPSTPPIAGHTWAQPTETDNHTPWNRQDPWNSWGTSNRLSFFLGFASFAIGGPGANTTGGSKTQTEVGLAYSFGGGFGLRLSTIQPVGAWALTFTFMRNRGIRLYDWGDPDVAVGYAMVAPEFGFASDFTTGHTFATAGLSIGGIRTVVGDLFSADLRFTPALWLTPISNDTPIFSFVLGVTIDLGFVH